MIGGGSTEMWLATGYAGLLTMFALGLDAVARHSHGRARDYELAGFRYHPQHDIWRCPTGQPLHRFHTDFQIRVARYRASAQVCNACAIKHTCTDSDRGREIEHHLDSWLSSELCRFQRGISLFLLAMAALVLVLEIARQDNTGCLPVLGGALVPVTALGMKALAALKAGDGGRDSRRMLFAGGERPGIVQEEPESVRRFGRSADDAHRPGTGVSVRKAWK